ncbi:hypothetical protein BH11PSE8_BH11PSE8_28720 [soil metagenome]
MLSDAETRLREANERLQIALAASGVVGLWDWMVDTDLLHGDANFARLYGLDAEKAAAGLTEAEYQVHVVAEDLVDLRGRIRDVFEHGHDFRVEYRLDIPNEARRWVECKGRMIHDSRGHPARFSGSCVDITRLKESEAALRASEAMARENADRVQLALAAGAIIGTWLWDLRRDHFTVDEAFARAFGIDPARGREGLSLAQVIETAHPDDRASLAEAIEEAIERGGPYAHQYRMRRTDGSYRWLQANGRVEHDPDGAPLRFPGVLIDIEDRRAVEAERERVNEMLRTLNETLESRVAERTAQLMQAEERSRQSQKMEAVGQLTGGVAHDFNNLLTVISASVALLRRETTSPAQRVRSIDAISKTVTRAAKLTGQLLAFARRQALTPTVFDASRNVTAITEMIETLVGARIQLETNLAEGCFIDADPGQFDTALVNLSVNARDAMDGTGRLTVAVRRVTDTPETENYPALRGPYVAVAVSDTGSGIEPESIERIFEPFYTTKPAGHGTGLGLSQVFGFAKQSGGDVHVESVVGKGTVFTLFFPLVVAPTAVEPLAPTPATMEVASGTTVLVVEDNWEVAAAVESTLQELGYATVHAADAKAALKEIERDNTRFSAVLTDVVMAGMDGVSLAREIRRRWPSLSVVLTSGYSHVLAQDADHGFEVLAKPYDLDALSKTLFRAIGMSGSWSNNSRPATRPSATIETMLDEAAAETRRQAELDSMQVLDTAPEKAFDDLVRMAADICGTPIALMSLIDRNRQWFKANVGLDAAETPREFAFCGHAIQQPGQVMIVQDATQDHRFASNPLVTGDPNIRFYAGAPLTTRTGQALGTLCVIAPAARELDPKQAEMLRLLADEAVKRLEQRRARLQSS